MMLAESKPITRANIGVLRFCRGQRRRIRVQSIAVFSHSIGAIWFTIAPMQAWRTPEYPRTNNDIAPATATVEPLRGVLKSEDFRPSAIAIRQVDP
jgi:hypothetical protein